MDNLNFYTVDLAYVAHLKTVETEKRGFSRVPNMDYGDKRKPKFLCGIVLEINGVDYYVPVTSYKQKKPDNFLIQLANGQVASSLRFNYMFPVPKSLLAERTITTEPDRAYRALLSQELRYCIRNQETIRHLAERTYKRVLLGKNPGLVANSCDFKLLEEACRAYPVPKEDTENS
jgi:protein AbiQ